jgi:hypothetical protein
MQVRTVTVLLICLVVFVLTQCVGKETKHSADFKTWSITSVESGGIDGRHLAFSIDNAGTLSFEDQRRKASAKMKMDDVETVARIQALLKQLDVPNAKKKSGEKKQECCDQVNSYIIFKLDGQEYYPDKSSFSSSQILSFESLLSIFGQIAEKNKPTLRNQAAELKIKNAKTLSISIEGANYKLVWEGKFSRQGESNIFEGEWKRPETSETVKDKVEVVISGRTIKITEKGREEIDGLREFEGDLDGYHPGIFAKKIQPNSFGWIATFE